MIWGLAEGQRSPASSRIVCQSDKMSAQSGETGERQSSCYNLLNFLSTTGSVEFRAPTRSPKGSEVFLHDLCRVQVEGLPSHTCRQVLSFTYTRARSWCVTATGFVPTTKVGPRTQVMHLRRSGYGAGGLWQRVEVSVRKVRKVS